MNKIALICGISGQDGAWLARLLLAKGYEVWGTSRDAQGSSFANLVRLGIRDRVRLRSMVPEDFRSVFMAFKQSRPDEVYFLAGQSSVGLSFEQPAETMQSNVLGMLNLLEACRMVEYPIRLYNAGSSEFFGDTAGQAANEKTPFHPRSPYAVAKASAFWLVNNYREAYRLFACTGILFNHESPLRPERFVTQKIISAARRIAKGSRRGSAWVTISLNGSSAWVSSCGPCPRYWSILRAAGCCSLTQPFSVVRRNKMRMNEIKASGSSLLRRSHAQPVLTREFIVYPFPTATHDEKGADAKCSPGSYRDVC